MFVRYLGGGIGHKATEDIQPILRTCKHAHRDKMGTEAQEDMADGDHAADHLSSGSSNECDEIDSDGINTDEEHQDEYQSGDSATRDSDSDKESTDRDEETFEEYHDYY